MSEQQQKQQPAEGPTGAEMSHYICRNIHILSREDCVDVGNVIVRDGSRGVIKECADGCRVELRDLSPQLIALLYDIIHHKVNSA